MRASGYIEYRRIGPLRPAPAAAAVFLCAALVCAAAAGRAGERVNDVVILRGGDVPGLAGTPLERIGGFAVKDGRLDAVPFQIDERDERGQLIYTKFGGGTTARPDGILGAADEILFMYRDAGGRRGGRRFPPARPPRPRSRFPIRAAGAPGGSTSSPSAERRRARPAGM